MGDLHADGQGKLQPADIKLQDHLSWGAQKRPAGPPGGGGPALGRTCSSVSHRLGRTTSTAGLRRNFSMRKSQSVREGGYRRIHDNISNSSGASAAAAAVDHEVGFYSDEAAASTTSEDAQAKDAAGKKKRKTGFRRAVKKFFGFART